MMDPWKLTRTAGDVVPFRQPRLPRATRPHIKIDGNILWLSTDSGPLMGDLAGDEEVPGGARLIKLPQGDKWKYLWVYDTDRQTVTMWRVTDGNEKVVGRASQMSAKIVQLDRKGQINRVDNQTFRRIERYMRRLEDRVLEELKRSIEENKQDWEREIEVQVGYYFDRFVRPKLERALADWRRGVYPFDFRPDKNLTDEFWTLERQALSHIMSKHTGRDSDFSYEKVQKYLENQGLDVADGPQEIEWAIQDVRDRVWDEVSPRRKYAMGIYENLKGAHPNALDMSLRVASRHLEGSDEYLTVEQIADMCLRCASEMVEAGLPGAYRSDLDRMAAKWEKLPKGWTQESVEKFWKSLTGDAKHKVTKCIKKMEGKMDDPGAFCASLADKVEGTAWRHEPRK